MVQTENMKLCGGTFFTLLLEARKPRMGVREHYRGEGDGLSEPEVLFALAKVVKPDWEKPSESMMQTIKGNVSEYKLCKAEGGTYFPFKEKDAKAAFDERIKSEYSVPYKAMVDLVDEFVDTAGSTKKDIRLVKALVELIIKDSSIDDGQRFFVNADGSSSTKVEILDMTEISFVAFLLGVWHYSVQQQNGSGKYTSDILCPAASGRKREYTGVLGEADRRVLTLTYIEAQDSVVNEHPIPELEKIKVQNEPEEEPIGSEDIEDLKTNSHQTNQTVNQYAISFMQNGNNNTQIGHVENYYANKKEQ